MQSIGGDAEYIEKPAQTIFDVVQYFSYSFLTVMLVANFVIGFNNFLEIVLLDYFTNWNDEVPGLATKHMAMFAFPKSLMLLYGLISDNFAIFGSHRKSWLLLTTAVNITVVAMTFTWTEKLSISNLLALMIVQSVTVGFLDAIIDGFAVQAARKEGVIDGAEKFQTFMIVV